MKRFKKIISMTMALLLLLGMTAMFASCGDDTEDTGTVNTGSQAEGLTALEVKDLGGYEFKMLWPEQHGDGHFMYNELYCPEYSADIIDSAIYTRNMAVESAYNVTITADTMKVSAIPTTVKTEYLATTSSYDAIATNIAFMSPLALEGMLADFDSLEYYDESQEWWNHDLMEDFSVATQKFYASGDIIYSDDFYPYCIYANPAVAEVYQITDNFFDLVRNKEWTLERIHEYALQASADTDGVAGVTVNDSHGMVANENFSRAIYYTAGKGMIELDRQGYPTWAMEPAYAQDILDKILTNWHADEAFWTSGDNQISGLTHAQVEIELFTTGKSLFLAEELIITERIRNAKNPLEDFYILPMPLYDEGGEYVSLLNDATVISIPVMCEDTDRSSLVLSAMSRESVNTLTPAFFETVLSHRYATNPDSLEMLNTILDSTVPQDVATINDWGGIMAAFKQCVVDNSDSFQSVYNSKRKIAMGELDAYITAVETVSANKK